MTASPRLTFPGSIDRRLRSWLTGHPKGDERGAIIFFRKLDREVEGQARSPRFVAIDMVEMDGAWILDSSPIHLRINLRQLPAVVFRCEQEGLELGFAHSHPEGARAFSAKDDRNEQAILKGYAGANGSTVSLVSLILCDGQWVGRVRPGADPAHAADVRHVTVLTEQIDVHVNRAEPLATETLQRQEAAFGKPFNAKLQSLRAVVVGAGGTGSPLATLLARSGIGELIIVDGDTLDGTNLNRVRGYRRADVGNNKAETLAAYITSLGLACQVSAIPEFLNHSPKAVDAIATADVVFGCTDDVAGRDVMTQAMYYYCIPYIDMGLTGVIREDESGVPYLHDHRGRISTVLPEVGACLRCQRVVTDAKLAYERALKERPELANVDPETLRREFYLTGGGESAPGVGPFTSAVADFALASFMNLLRPFRRLSTEFRQDNVWVDFVHLNIYSNLPTDDSACFCCGASGLLNASERGYRLGLPSLGRIPAL